jgi:hypothetical protein
MALPFTPHMPLSNPLTAEDTGSYATIEIKPFVMAIPGRSVHVERAGAIVLLSHETVYYVYFDDPRFGSQEDPDVTYNASISAVTAGFGGRFFVGSIRTPAKGGSPTIGNGDGGTPGGTTDTRTDLGTSAPESELDVTNPANQRKSFVRHILEGKGWSTLDWAKHSGVDYNTAAAYLKGKKSYRSTRKKLADSLGIRVEDLPA